MSEGGDIAFHVSRESPDEVVDLVPHGRIDSHLVIEEGQIVCDCIGKCKEPDFKAKLNC